MEKKAFKPEEILPDGDDYAFIVNPFTGVTGKARKGIVAATLSNIALLDRLLEANIESAQISLITEEVVRLVPSLKAVGIFDLFKIAEWISDPKRLGRIYVAALYLKYNSEEMTPELTRSLIHIQQTTKSNSLSAMLREII